MSKWFQSDERTERMGDRLGFIVLGITWLGLYLSIAYQRYVLELEPVYYNDLAIILILSVVGYWGARFYLGSVLPTPSLRQVSGIYLGLVLIIAIPHTLVHGFPRNGEWLDRLVPILGGPAVLVGAYTLLAYLGNKQIEKHISRLDSGQDKEAVVNQSRQQFTHRAYLFLPICVGLGTGLGALIGNIGVGLAIGAGVGTTLSLLGWWWEENRKAG